MLDLLPPGILSARQGAGKRQEGSVMVLVVGSILRQGGEGSPELKARRRRSTWRCCVSEPGKDYRNTAGNPARPHRD
jgi:hypothetical protein